MAEVRISNLRKCFGDLNVLKDVSLHVNDGEFLTLLGPSGCGKSTLLRIIAGLEDITAGSIHIAERCVNGVRPKDRNIAMVFQSYALYPHLSVFDNVAMPLRMRLLNRLERTPLVGPWLPSRRHTEKQISRAVEQVAETLDIAHLLIRKPNQLSGGQRQRVALGRAMVRNPSVFLMDEPLSNLDAKLRVHMRTEIAGLHRKLGSTFIYVTHDQAEAMTMSDRVALMIDGELLQIAPPKEIYENPQHLKVAEFIGSPKINLIPGTLRSDGAVDSCGTTLTCRLYAGNGCQLQIGVRPEALRIIENNRSGWCGKVVHLEHLGPYFLIHTLLPGMATPVISRVGSTRMAEPVIGATIRLGGTTDSFLFFDKEGQRLHPQPELLKNVANV